MAIAQLTRLPRLWASDFAQHRRVTWLELFFDLVFVAAVAEVGSPLSVDYSPAGLFRYAFLFVLIWWGWSGHTLYCTRFDHDDLANRLLVLAQCFIAAVMAANAKRRWTAGLRLVLPRRIPGCGLFRCCSTSALAACRPLAR